MSASSVTLDLIDRGGSVAADAEGTSRAKRQQLASGELLYREGDSRDGVFRIETGAFAVYRRRVGRPNGKIEIAVPGDFVGLGCLEAFSENAKAISASTVTRLTRDEFVALAEIDDRLKQLQADAIEREFDARKELLTSQGRTTPIECVAAFLVAISRQNASEGRDPTLISDTLDCGTVAGLLNMDLDTLGHCLVRLQRADLIAQTPDGGIRLRSLDVLNLVADGQVCTRLEESSSAPILEAANDVTHWGV